MLNSRIGRLAGASALAVTTPLLLGSIASSASAETSVDRPDSFTSAFTVNATPDEVISPEGEPVDGEEGASGTFNYMINSDEEIICYDIEIRGVTTPYESMAKTSTHLHEAVAGSNGPPRIAFPDPEGDGDVKTSSGCLQGPFTTGLEGDDGNDTGEGFTLSMVESNPIGYSSDTHTADFVPGAIRGQLSPMPVGGVDTGLGGAQSAGVDGSMIAVSSLAAVAIAGGAVMVRRRVRA